MSNTARMRMDALKRPIVIACIILGIVLGVSLSLAGSWLYIALPRGTLSVLIGVVTILAGGTALFWFREACRLYYGALELGVAAAIAVQGLEHMQVLAESWPAVVAALYLVVRALDNIWKAVEPDTEHHARLASM